MEKDFRRRNPRKSAAKVFLARVGVCIVDIDALLHFENLENPPNAVRLPLPRFGLSYFRSIFAMSSGVSTRQIRAAPSTPAVTICPPSGEKPASRIGDICPWRTVSNRPSVEFHTRAVPSLEAVTIRSPSLENRAAQTSAVWPRMVLRSRPSELFHTRAV